MKHLTLILLFSSVAIANPIKKSDLAPGQEEPYIPGTQVPLEELNTAPTSPQLEEENEDYRNILKAREEKEKELKHQSRKVRKKT